MCLIATMGAVNVRIQTNVASLLPEGSPVLDRFRDLEAVFGSTDLMLFAIESDQIPTDPEARAAHIQARSELAATVAQRVQAWQWYNKALKADEEMVSAVLGAPSDEIDAARMNLLVANTWLFFGDRGIDQSSADAANDATSDQQTDPIDSLLPWLQRPDRLAKRIERPSPTVLPKWQSRDPIGWWKDVYVPWWQSRLSDDGPVTERDGFLVTRDDQSHLLICSPTRQSQESAFCDAVVTRSNELNAWLRSQQTTDASGLVARPEWQGLTINAIGGYYIAYRDFHSATSSALITAVTSLIGVMLLFTVAYRSLSLAGMIGVCLIPAIAAALGLSAILLGGELSMIVSGFAAILIGLGVDFFIHIYNAYGWSLTRLLKERALQLADQEDHPVPAPNRRERCQLRGVAAVEAIESVGGGLVAAAATSVATFLILLLSHYKGLQELGAVCGMGLLLILVMALLGAPAFLTIAGGMQVRPSKLMDRFAGFMLRRPLPWAALLILLVGGSAAFLVTRPELFAFDRDPRNLRPSNDPYYKGQQDAILRLGLKSSGHYLLLQSDDQAALITTARELSERLIPLLEPIEARSANDQAITVVPGHPVDLALTDLPADAIIAGRRHIWIGEDLLLARHQADGVLYGLEPAEPQTLTIPANAELTLGAAVQRISKKLLWFTPPNQQLLNLQRLRDEVDWDAVTTMLEQLDTEDATDRAPFISDLTSMRDRVLAQQPLLPDELRDSALHDIVGMIYRRQGDRSFLRMEIPLSRMDSDGLIALYPHLGLDEFGSGQIGDVSYGTSGPPSIAVSIQQLLEVDFKRMGILALATTAVLIMVCLRSIKGSLHALSALLGGLIVTLAWVHLVGQTWNLMNVAIVPLIVGIGIDNGIHFVHALRHTHLGGVAAVRQAFVEVGHPIVMTSLTSVVGFASLLLNDFRGIQSCGTTAVIGIISCLVVAVISLPLLALLHAKMHARDSSTDN